MSTRTRFVAGVAACLAGASLAVGVPAAASTADPPPSAYTVRLLRAVDTCQAKMTRTSTFPQFVSCTRELAAPTPGNAHEVDIWRLVLDCLWFGWSPYDGFDDDAVNSCLDDGGVL